METTSIDSYTKTFEVRWSDLDPNRHLRNTAYSDFATNLRICILEEKGFSFSKFNELQFGPIYFKEEVQYFREVSMGEIITIDCTLAALSPDGSRWKFHHNIYKEDQRLSATINAEGAWLDLKIRKLTPPTADLLEVLRGFPRSPDYNETYFDKKK